MLLLLGFQRALTFQKFQSSSNYVPDEEIKDPKGSTSYLGPRQYK